MESNSNENCHVLKKVYNSFMLKGDILTLQSSLGVNFIITLLVLTSYPIQYILLWHHESVLYFSLSAKVVFFSQSAKF